MTDSYRSIPDLVGGVAENQELYRALQKEIEDRKVAKVLFAVRAAAGKTQGQLAKDIGRSQASVSKLENATDDRVRVSDMMAYARALGLHLTIRFDKRNTAVNEIKHHAFEIRRLLDHLIDLAKDDNEILKGVADFHVETLVNVVKLIAESAATISPPAEPEERPVLEISSPTLEGSEDPVPT